MTAVSVSGSLRLRGLPMALLLIVRLVVTGVGVAAGLALARRRVGAAGFAQVALMLSAGMDLVSYLTPYWPNNRMPGDTPLYVAASLLYHVVWIAYLRRSRRVRNTLDAR
jgi:hypothetical protein